MGNRSIASVTLLTERYFNKFVDATVSIKYVKWQRHTVKRQITLKDDLRRI